MKFTKSIQWRLLLWIAFLLGLVLLALDFTAYKIHLTSRVGQLDGELQHSVAVLSAALSPPLPEPAITQRGRTGGWTPPGVRQSPFRSAIEPARPGYVADCRHHPPVGRGNGRWVLLLHLDARRRRALLAIHQLPCGNSAPAAPGQKYRHLHPHARRFPRGVPHDQIRRLHPRRVAGSRR